MDRPLIRTPYTCRNLQGNGRKERIRRRRKKLNVNYLLKLPHSGAPFNRRIQDLEGVTSGDRFRWRLKLTPGKRKNGYSDTGPRTPGSLSGTLEKKPEGCM
ncbi:hypothetical protein KNP414_05460 [Paenibacillus mucilaginosus KNP414]|uniref:Uncharacterized protein n=1 Tax=Paenibacillus mucilaginosus (strain KNP414) TaxID=1036673 RepID=F8FI81_PAEMK|nr:hypothetical protein KNP414_05460 [Paenibacillus mucilaginosus KNP414]